MAFILILNRKIRHKNGMSIIFYAILIAVVLILIHNEMYKKPKTRLKLTESVIKYNEECTEKAEGILRKWKYTMEISNYNFRISSSLILPMGIIYYSDKNGHEHYIDIMENKIMNHKRIPSGAKLQICYNPKNPDEAYISLDEQYIKQETDNFRKNYIIKICLIFIAVVCLCILSYNFDISIISYIGTRMNKMFITLVVVVCFLMGFITVLLDMLLAKIILLNSERKCTIKAQGTLNKWSEHKMTTSDGWKSASIYMAEVSFKDKDGIIHVADIAEKDEFNHVKVNKRTKIPIQINPNNKFEACIDYKQFIKYRREHS